MAEEFEVRGPHEHKVEHAAAAGDSFSGKIAVMAAVLASAGAFFSYQAGSTLNAAAMFKNDAAIEKTAAANQWNFYQAKSSKQNLAELALSLSNSDHVKYVSAIERYGHEKTEIKQAAEKLEAASSAWDEKSEVQMHVHHRWALAMTLTQVAISLAAITLLTRRKMLLVGVYGMTLVGLIYALLALFQI